jgi:hypothetical protein
VAVTVAPSVSLQDTSASNPTLLYSTPPDALCNVLNFDHLSYSKYKKT